MKEQLVLADGPVYFTGTEAYIFVAQMWGLTEAEIAEELTESRGELWTRDQVSGIIRRCGRRFQIVGLEAMGVA